jgi:hypothetical protein
MKETARAAELRYVHTYSHVPPGVRAPPSSRACLRGARGAAEDEGDRAGIASPTGLCEGAAVPLLNAGEPDRRNLAILRPPGPNDGKLRQAWRVASQPRKQILLTLHVRVPRRPCRAVAVPDAAARQGVGGKGGPARAIPLRAFCCVRITRPGYHGEDRRSAADACTRGNGTPNAAGQQRHREAPRCASGCAAVVGGLVRRQLLGVCARLGGTSFSAYLIALSHYRPAATGAAASAPAMCGDGGGDVAAAARVSLPPRRPRSCAGGPLLAAEELLEVLAAVSEEKFPGALVSKDDGSDLPRPSGTSALRVWLEISLALAKDATVHDGNSPGGWFWNWAAYHFFALTVKPTFSPHCRVKLGGAISF